MKLRTEIIIPKEKHCINYNSKIVLYGSCFTENLERHFNHYKFQNVSNSHGILFHPKAIENAITDCIIKKDYTEHHIQNFNDLWLSLNHHTRFSSVNIDEILTLINSEINETHQVIKSASHIFITLGTAWVYRYIKTNLLVANCHKIQQNEFKKELLTIDEITKSLNHIVSEINQFNSNAKILFTVSPVRHLKDGFRENTLSKAYLNTAIHKILDNKKTFYFPSFEIMMDDLRDYRFYKNDMLHPNETAVSYIWNIFKNTWIDEGSYDIMHEVDSIQKSLEHKPFHDQSKQHQLFLSKLDKKIESLTKRIPHIRFDNRKSV